MSTLSINEVIGASLFVRNLQPFTGGHPAYSVRYATTADQQAALLRARSVLSLKVNGLHYPCREVFRDLPKNLLVSWSCQFVQPPHADIPNARITGIRLVGKNLLVDVTFVAQPRRWAR